MTIETLDILDFDWDQPASAPIKAKIIAEDLTGKPLAFIIGEEVANTMALTDSFADLLLSIDSFTDAGVDGDRYLVNLIKDGEIINILSCSEMEHAIFLSDPLILDYSTYDNFLMVTPGWNFVNNAFVSPLGN